MGTHLFSTGAMKEEAYRRKVKQAVKRLGKSPGKLLEVGRDLSKQLLVRLGPLDEYC